MNAFNTLDTLDVAAKRVIVRADLNVPMKDGKVTDTTRIDRLIPTLKELQDKGAKIVIISHFGRPKGHVLPEYSLKQIVPALEEALGDEVKFCDDCIGAKVAEAVDDLQEGDVLLLENLRFYKEETDNDPAFAAKLATAGDLYLNDAFSCAHRAHASTEALAKRLPNGAGRLMQQELEALQKALSAPKHPVIALVGGAKISTKLALLENLVTKVDKLILGGGMANTFLYATGLSVGASLCEKEMAEQARTIMAKAEEENCQILLPKDGIFTEEFKENATAQTLPVTAIPDTVMMLDIGPQSIKAVQNIIASAKTLVWNGPLGAFEITPFDTATNEVAAFAGALTAEGKLLSVAGGGDTVAALSPSGATEKFSYISSAGGAFLEWLEGKDLPGVKALEQN